MVENRRQIMCIVFYFLCPQRQHSLSLSFFLAVLWQHRFGPAAVVCAASECFPRVWIVVACWQLQQLQPGKTIQSRNKESLHRGAGQGCQIDFKVT